MFFKSCGFHINENLRGSPAQQGNCYIDRAPVQNGKGPPPQFELNLIFLIYLGTLDLTEDVHSRYQQW